MENKLVLQPVCKYKVFSNTTPTYLKKTKTEKFDKTLLKKSKLTVEEKRKAPKILFEI